MLTSLDYLYIVLTVCIFVFTGFLVWIMYYIGTLLKQGNEMVKEFRQKMQEIEEAIMSIKDKIFTSAQSISFLVKEFKHISGMVSDFRNRKKNKAGAGRRRAKKAETVDVDEDADSVDDEDLG